MQRKINFINDSRREWRFGGGGWGFEDQRVKEYRGKENGGDRQRNIN